MLHSVLRTHFGFTSLLSNYSCANSQILWSNTSTFSIGYLSNSFLQMCSVLCKRFTNVQLKNQVTPWCLDEHWFNAIIRTYWVIIFLNCTIVKPDLAPKYVGWSYLAGELDTFVWFFIFVGTPTAAPCINIFKNSIVWSMH